MRYGLLKESKYIGVGQVPDGYFGDWCKVSFFFHPESGKTFASHEGGYYTYSTPVAIDANEAIWLLKNHPASNARFIVSV